MNNGYFGVPHIDNTKDFGSEADVLFFNSIGTELVERALHSELGVCLLHTHFEFDDSEVLLSSIEETGLWTDVVKKESLDKTCNPYMWRYLNGSVVPIQFIRAQKDIQFPQINIPIDFGEHFGSSYMENRFGLFDYRYLPLLEQGSILLESSSSSQRWNWLRSKANETSSDVNLRQTTWVFEPTLLAGGRTYCEERSVAVTVCESVSSYCKSSCDGGEYHHTDCHDDTSYIFARHTQETEYRDRHYQERE